MRSGGSAIDVGQMVAQGRPGKRPACGGGLSTQPLRTPRGFRVPAPAARRRQRLVVVRNDDARRQPAGGGSTL